MSAVPVLSPAEDLHTRLLAARAEYRRSERDLAVLLADLADRRLFLDLGHASVHAYGAAVLDLTPRHTAALVRIGRRLPELPALDAAFASAEIGWTKAREVVAVASPDTEAAWLDRARTLSSRDLERHVAAARDGSPPSEDDVLKHPSRVRLVFEVDAQDAAVLRDALAVLRTCTGTSAAEIEDGALLAEMARRVIHDAQPDEAPAAERYRTVLVHCPRCRLATGVDDQVNDTHVGLASCDGEVIEMRSRPRRGHLSRQIPPAVRRAVLHRDRWRCAVPCCGNRLWLDVHHVRERHRGGASHVAHVDHEVGDQPQPTEHGLVDHVRTVRHPEGSAAEHRAQHGLPHQREVRRVECRHLCASGALRTVREGSSKECAGSERGSPNRSGEM
jgi:hypothetical protein